MKKQFHSIASKYGLSIFNYESYRSDMGFQVFEFYIGKDGQKKTLFDEGYAIGLLESTRIKEQARILKDFEKLCKSLSTPPPTA